MEILFEYNKKCIVYKLLVDENNIYIGSSKCLGKRLQQHKSDYLNPNSTNYNCKLYQYMRDNNISFETVKCYVLEYCDNKSCRMREQHYIQTLEPTLNKNKAYTSINEKIQYQIEYRIKNKELFNTPNQCCCGGFYTYKHKCDHIKTKKHQIYCIVV